MDSLSAANAQFCLDVFKEISYDHTIENIFFSPLGLLSALAVVFFGARGESASQMEKVCHKHTFSDCEQDTGVHSYIQALLSEISKTSHSQVHMASGMYAEEAHPFLPKYLDCIEQLYKLKPENLGFKNNLEDARTQINARIENETKGEIKDLVLPTSLTSSDQLVLVNAISFRGTWKYAFHKDQTTAMPFRWIHNIVQMCQGQCLVLNLLSHNGNSKIEITYEKLKDWIYPTNMKDTAVVLHLPQLRLDGYHDDLTSILAALGMMDVFDPSKANLSGIIAGGGLEVSKIIHKATLEVIESGSEFTLTNQTNQVENHEIFKVDHPFLFFILHKETKIILFCGRVFNP
uniref:Serpin domain-containing protein n=1 Tax=Catagonus wagneri TaxID=51154 RepID=A0A8C3WQN1_9CETA